MSVLNRRAFLADLGKGVTAAIVVAACASESSSSTAGATTTTGASSPSTRSSPTSTSANPTTSTESSTPADGYNWARVDLGFVSAYLLVRSGEAVLVDTGVANSEGAIGAVLGELGLDWSAVGHLIVTHEHPDHQGSVRAVLELASAATGYAAQPDLGNIASPRPFTEVVDGDEVEGFTIIASPGHTAGHISILDPGRVLLTGDALNNTDGALTGPNPQFSSDMPTGIESAKMLATFDYEVALFGHGGPIESGASQAIAELAATL
jgi:glyoxylase-like metal-dependent hydrolase (beta-lactamase superfamily II)